MLFWSKTGHWGLAALVMILLLFFQKQNLVTRCSEVGQHELRPDLKILVGMILGLAKSESEGARREVHSHLYSV